jgi:hypothetical protein
LNGSDTTITLTGDIELQNTGVLTLKDGFTLTAEQPATLTVGDGVHLQVSSMAQVNPNATILSGGSGNVVLVKNGGSAYQQTLFQSYPSAVTYSRKMYLYDNKNNAALNYFSDVSVEDTNVTLEKDHYLINSEVVLSNANVTFTLTNDFVNLLNGGTLVLVNGLETPLKFLELVVEEDGTASVEGLPLYTDGTFKDYDIMYKLNGSETLIDTGCNISLTAMAVFDNTELSKLHSSGIQFGHAYKVATVFNPLNWRVKQQPQTTWH